MNPVLIVFFCLFGYLGFREASRFHSQHGRAPWGLPPWVWALLVGSSLFFGGLLLVIARRTTRTTAAPRLPTDLPPSQGGPMGQTVLPRL